MMNKNIYLKNHTTLRIGGKADYFIVAKQEQQIIESIKQAQRDYLPFLIIGGGSNILFSDKGYQGVVIKNETKKVEIKNDNKVVAQAGASLSKVLNFCLINKLQGLEWTAGIPGTIGGAVKGNAGAFNSSMKDCIVSVKFYNPEKDKIETFKNKDCLFNYRESVFKKKDNYVILSVEMKFNQQEPFLINEKIKECLKQRKQKQPHGFSAGSVFKNYIIPENEKEKYKQFKNNIIPAAYLIEQCGLKGKVVGRAMISRVHANFIINLGQAKAIDVLKLISIIEQQVQKKFKISLQREIILVNSFKKY